MSARQLCANTPYAQQRFGGDFESPADLPRPVPYPPGPCPACSPRCYQDKRVFQCIYDDLGELVLMFVCQRYCLLVDVAACF